MMSRILCHLWLMLAPFGCHSNRNTHDYEAEANAAAELARHAVAAELKVGSAEPDILDFFKRHGWHCGFDEFQSRFYCPVFRSPEGTQVDLHIYVDAIKKFVRSDVQVHHTYY
jgi:hypothetical protein